MWIKTHRYLARMKDPQPTNASSPKTYKSRYTRRQIKDKDPTVNKTEYRNKKNPTAKPPWARQQPKHQAPTISSIDKSLSRNHHRVRSPTHRCAIKEESKCANRDWVDYQACSLLQYINVIANLFIMGNCSYKLRWKIIRANNLLQFIHQVDIEIRFRKSLAQERFKSNLEFRNQIIVSSIKFWKCFAKFIKILKLSIVRYKREFSGGM